MSLITASLLDEVLEQEGGVADDACGPGLFVLTALQDQSIVHVTFRMQTGLQQETGNSHSDH